MSKYNMNFVSHIDEKQRLKKFMNAEKIIVLDNKY